MRSASSRMNTLRLASWGASAAMRSSSRTSSIRIIGAPFGLSRGGVGAITWQSGCWPAATRRHVAHVPHPCAGAERGLAERDGRQPTSRRPMDRRTRTRAPGGRPRSRAGAGRRPRTARRCRAQARGAAPLMARRARADGSRAGRSPRRPPAGARSASITITRSGSRSRIAQKPFRTRSWNSSASRSKGSHAASAPRRARARRRPSATSRSSTSVRSGMRPSVASWFSWATVSSGRPRP